MPEEIEIIKFADETIKNGQLWLDYAKSIYDSVSHVERAVKLSQEVKSAFIGSPFSFEGYDLAQIKSEMAQTSQSFSLYNNTSSFDPLSASITGSAFLTSASSSLSSMLAFERSSSQAEVAKWASTHLLSLSAIQTDEVSRVFISNQLRSLYTGSEVEFNESISAFMAIKNGIGLASAAGIAMRNVLESLNGNLKQLARCYIGGLANQRLSWSDVASAIAKGGSGGGEAAQLTTQESEYRYLHDDVFTKVAKNDWTPTLLEWEPIYVRYISFLYTVLGLIDFTRPRVATV